MSDDLVLSSDSARALDALIEAGFDVAKVSPELRARAQQAAKLLAMLDGPALAGDPALTDVIMARVAMSDELPAEMSAADHAALESLVMHGFEPARVPGSLRQRAERHRALADLVCAARVAPADGLVDRTLAAVQREIDAEEDRFSFESRRAIFGGGMRLADIMSVAAMLLIGTAVVWPLVTSLRESQQRALCFGRIGTMATAFGSYAADAADALPIAAGSVTDGVWWDVGTRGRSNSANLYKLAPEGYLTVGDMACPGNADARTAEAAPGEQDWHTFDEVSYSYQHIDIASSRPWERDRFVVLADRSPITVLNKRGEVAPAEANSLNHGQRGQRVLMSDGSADWLRSPVLPDGDNIWLPRVVEVVLDNMRAGQPLLKGLERPVSSTDSMLVP